VKVDVKVESRHVISHNKALILRNFQVTQSQKFGHESDKRY